MPPIDPVENNKVEVAKALLAVRSVATPEQYDQIRDLLAGGSVEQNVEDAVRGLSREDEFALMCRIMGTATHMVHLDQRPVIPGEYLVPDFLARFQPGCFASRQTANDSSGYRCLVEVKSTKRMKYQVGGQRLRRLRTLADEFGLPLVIAVRFLAFDNHAHWVMIVDDDRTKTSLTITPADLERSVRHVLWDEFFYMPMPGMIAEYVFKQEPHPDCDHQHGDYGFLHEARYHAQETHVAVVGVEAMMAMAFMEAFLPEEVEVRSEGDSTHVKFMNKQLMCFVSDLLFYFNRLFTDNQGRAVFDPSRILAGTDNLLVTRQLTDQIAKLFFGNNLMGYVTIGEESEHIRKWLAMGGREMPATSDPPVAQSGVPVASPAV